MKYLVAALGAATFLTGCLKTRNEVRENEGRQVMQQQVATLQKTNADSSGRVAELEDQIRHLNGRLEVMENRTERMSVGAESMVKNSQQQSQEVSQKLAVYQEAMSKLEKDIQTLNSEIQGLKAQQAAYDAAKSSNSAAGNRNSFEVAEDHFDKKEWKQAILNYQKYRDANPKGSKFAEATYKIGVSFQELGMKDEAKTFYDEVVAKSSKSDSARRAKVRLKNLK